MRSSHSTGAAVRQREARTIGRSCAGTLRTIGTRRAVTVRRSCVRRVARDPRDSLSDGHAFPGARRAGAVAVRTLRRGEARGAAVAASLSCDEASARRSSSHRDRVFGGTGAVLLPKRAGLPRREIMVGN